MLPVTQAKNCSVATSKETVYLFVELQTSNLARRLCFSTSNEINSLLISQHVEIKKKNLLR